MSGLLLVLDRLGNSIAQLESFVADKDAHIAKQAEALHQNAERIAELEAENADLTERVEYLEALVPDEPTGTG